MKIIGKNRSVFVNDEAISTPLGLLSFLTIGIKFVPHCGLLISREDHILHSIKFGE